MRSITKQMSLAFFKGENKSLNNTVVKKDGNLVEMFLHWNWIAHYDIKAGSILLDDCGRQTNTTKERLNWVLNEFVLWKIYQKQGQWYYKNWKWEVIKWERMLLLHINNI